MGAKNHDGVRRERRAGRDVLVLDFRYRTKDGRMARFRRDAAVQMMTAARAEAQRLKRYAVEHGTVEPPNEMPTFERFARATFFSLVMPTYSPSTRERYLRLFEREGLFEVLGNKRLDEIEERAVLELAAVVRQRGAVPRQHQILARGVLKLAVRLGVLERMPHLPPTPRQPKKLPAAPSREVVEMILAGARGWLKLAVALGYFAGMRNGEARAFRPMDAVRDISTAVVRQAFSDGVVQPPKYGADRALPMHPRLLALVDEASAGKKPTDFLVVDETGKPPSRQKLYKSLVALEKKIGISPTWSFHQIRHAFGTHALAAGANVEAVRELLGHSSLEVTSRYLHAIAQDKAAVIAALGGDGQLVGNGGGGESAGG